MRSLGDQLDQDHNSMGPGTDLIISLLAIFLIVLGILKIDYNRLEDKFSKLIADHQQLKNENQDLLAFMNEQDSLVKSYQRFRQEFIEKQILLNQIAKSQSKIIEAVSSQFFVNPQVINKDSSEFKISALNVKGDITIKNMVTSQRIYFGSNILFEKNESTLKSQGQNVLSKVGEGLKHRLSKVSEIQILGHADTFGDEDFNLDLAGDRANAVYKYFQHNVGINPLENILSATSYGEYMPVTRSYDDKYFSEELLIKANTTSNRAKNRRIEIVLKFRESSDL